MNGNSLFKSFWMGGFECSTHYARTKQRLDMLATTRHDAFLAQDYARLHEFGISTVREGVRWHSVQKKLGEYDLSTVVYMQHLADEYHLQIIWDLFHFGYPDILDPFTPAFVRHYVAYARAFAQRLKNETDATPIITPINEISFLAFHGAEVGNMNPFTRGRGHELKEQLVRAAIEGMEAIWEVLPHARFMHNDPIFNTVADTNDPVMIDRARAYSYARYQAWDMLAGSVQPELGGNSKYLDILGVDYYPWNQWLYRSDYDFGATLAADDARYVPLRFFLQEIFERYARPLIIAETSTEYDARPQWLAYVGRETRLALQMGVPLQGICWYPIVNFSGWDDGRLCENGLWGDSDVYGNRPLSEPLAREWYRQRTALAHTLEQMEVARA